MFQPIYHVSFSPTDGNGPTQGQRKTLTRVGIEPTTFGFDHHPGQSFPLSLCGPISICWAKAHMVYGLKHQHFTSHSITTIHSICYSPLVVKSACHICNVLVVKKDSYLALTCE